MPGDKNPFFGKKHKPETIEKMRLAKLGKKHTEEHKEKIRKSCFNINMGENNGMWKSNNIGYFGIHRRIKTLLHKPELCEMCEQNEPQELSNISGNYLLDLSDWQWLCKKCHKKYDYIGNNLRGCEISNKILMRFGAGH
jgi:hypothetical protein